MVLQKPWEQGPHKLFALRGLTASIFITLSSSSCLTILKVTEAKSSKSLNLEFSVCGTPNLEFLNLKFSIFDGPILEFLNREFQYLAGQILNF